MPANAIFPIFLPNHVQPQILHHLQCPTSGDLKPSNGFIRTKMRMKRVIILHRIAWNCTKKSATAKPLAQKMPGHKTRTCYGAFSDKRPYRRTTASCLHLPPKDLYTTCVLPSCDNNIYRFRQGQSCAFAHMFLLNRASVICSFRKRCIRTGENRKTVTCRSAPIREARHKTKGESLTYDVSPTRKSAPECFDEP